MSGGGAERQLGYLAGELTNMGWEVHVALLSDGPNFRRLESGGVAIHRLRARSNYDPRIGWQLLGTIRAIRPRLVQVWLVQMEVFAGLAAWIMRVPWIFSERSSAMAYPATFKNRLRILFAGAASAVVSNSVGGDQYWNSRLDIRVPRYVIPNGLPLNEIEAARPVGPEESGLVPEESVVLFVGRFSPEKNLETLRLALRYVVSRPRTVAVLCGEGPLRPQIERQLAEDGIGDRVRLPGYVGDVWRWMKRANVLVSVGFFEGHPNAVLEAMACGCPLVISDIPAHREFLNEESALLVDAHAPAAIAQAIASVFTAPEAAARRAQNARAKAAQWSSRAVARQYVQVYQEVLARRSQSGLNPG